MEHSSKHFVHASTHRHGRTQTGRVHHHQKTDRPKKPTQTDMQAKRDSSGQREAPHSMFRWRSTSRSEEKMVCLEVNGKRFFEGKTTQLRTDEHRAVARWSSTDGKGKRRKKQGRSAWTFSVPLFLHSPSLRLLNDRSVSLSLSLSLTVSSFPRLEEEKKQDGGGSDRNAVLRHGDAHTIKAHALLLPPMHGGRKGEIHSFIDTVKA
mmetsp:Transcript_46219/g.91134  ORF Transcript_46219/g.91134 Transcript_46219/m.91134 type:complete len:207 (+) Transcript_46219:228-848(+)